MPLDGFRILQWAGENFGSLPPSALGGFGVAVLLAGVVMVVIGFRMHPTSWGLVAAGVGCFTLTYFIIGAAIAAASNTLAGTSNVQAAAPRIVPWAVCTIAVGIAMFGLRKALEAWSSEEASGKLAGALVALISLGSIFVGVQVVRGSLGASRAAVAPSAEDAEPPSSADDANVRRRGAVRH